MSVLKSHGRLAAGVLAAMAIVLAPLFAAQRGPSKTKMPPLSAEQKASSKDKADRAAKTETRRTPFGEAKSTAKTDDVAPAAATSPFLEVEEKGDTIVFQRRTPFGLQTWNKKRSELTPQEEEMLRAQQAKQSAGSAQDAGKDKAGPASPKAATPAEAPTASGQDREKR